MTLLHKRTGWLCAALGLCSSLVLVLGVLWDRDPRPTLSAPAGIDREHVQVRGRSVPATRWEGIPREIVPAPQRTADKAQPKREPCPVTAPVNEGLAVLTGRITCGGRGVLAQVRFDLGWNEGRVLDTTNDGEFSGRDLGPGYQLVTVTVEGRPPCRRSLFLTPYRKASLALDFGVSSPMRVRVLDAEGRPVAGAAVEVDGAPTTTDNEGRAVLTSVCSGPSDLVVRAPGYAWFSCALERADAEVELRLDPACSLELSLPAAAGASEAVVYLLPHAAERLAGRPVRPATPWHLVSPLRIAAGATVRLDNLPAGELEIRVLEHGARVGIERVVLGTAHPVVLALKEKKPATGEVPDLGSLRNVLSSDGIGSLPRSQPLAKLR